MSELFSHLLQRHQGAIPLVAPRRPSRFETAGGALAAAASPFREEAPRPVETAEEFPLQAALPPAPAAVDHPGLAGLDAAPQPQRALSETVPPKEAPRPRVQLSRFFDPDDHRRAEADTDAVHQPAPAYGKILPRFFTRIVPGAEPPAEAPAPGASRLSDLPVLPATVAARPIHEPSGIQPPVPRRRPMVDPGPPVTAMARSQDHPQVPTPGNPNPVTPDMQRPTALGQALLGPAGEHGPRTREDLLVPPEWPARMQHDFQRNWDATAHKAKPEPTIHVTIGRVEVRAEAVPAPPKPRAKEKASPVMSLDEYLSQRKGRG